MYDLKKIGDLFNEYLKMGLNEEYWDLNKIKITKKLLEQQEAFYIPFGRISYFLVIEDEKAVLYVHESSRMDLSAIVFIDENGYERYDLFLGNHEDINEKYYNHLKKVRRFKDKKDIRDCPLFNFLLN